MRKEGDAVKAYVIGVGMGNPALLTREAWDTIRGCKILIGAQRLLDAFPEVAARKIAAASPAKMAEAVLACGEGEAAVLVSGDVGFYSAARKLKDLLDGAKVVFLPGISSLQYFCAKLCTAWDDARVVSLHGRDCDLCGIVASSPKVFALTGGENGPGALCARLQEAGLGAVWVEIGERLSYPDERITRGSAAELAGKAFDPLSVMLIGNPAARPRPAAHGLPDGAFLRGGTPMTKEEVRAVSIVKLRLRRGMTVWDVGAGTGSVSVEIARVLEDGVVYAVEREADALALIERNRARFGLWNLRPAAGCAPEALEGLPAPDAVFIGGSSGKLMEIVGAALEKNLAARIVINAVTLETVTVALGCFERLSLRNPDAVQLSVSRVREVGSHHIMQAQNPVWILSAGGSEW